MWRRLVMISVLLMAVAADRKFDARILNTQVEQVDRGGPHQQHEENRVDPPTQRHGVLFPPPPGGQPPPIIPPPGSGTWSSVRADVSTGTRLTVRPGEPSRLQFEVTNLRDEPQPLVFSASDTLGLVRAVQPPRSLVAPRGISRTTVELFPTRTEGSEGLVNTVTFLVQAADGTTATRSALIRVTAEKEDHDGWWPECSFTVPWGQCREFGYSSGASCGAAGWSAEVTVRDDLSGLLRVESSPPNNLLPSRYVAGSRAPVTMLLAASCCQENMQIRVWDAAGNSRTCEAYVYGLTSAEIAAISLGVILLIALIILIVLACLLCRSSRKRRRHELPRRPSP